MARGHGRAPTPDHVRLLRGTFQPCRAHGDTPPPPWDPADVVIPEWLTPAARAIFTGKLAVYASRGDDLRGCEEALACYASLQAEMVADWRAGVSPNVGTITAYRMWCTEFHDTPASRTRAAVQSAATSGNRFAKNGKPTP